MVRRPVALTAVLAALATAGCGAADPPPASEACTTNPAAMLRALGRAPATVRLSDGASLSSCIRGGVQDEGQLQDVGVVVTEVADELARRIGTAPHAALQLGYLVGAVGDAAGHTNGVGLELARRVAQSAALTHMTARERRAFARGRRAGARRG